MRIQIKKDHDILKVEKLLSTLNFSASPVILYGVGKLNPANK